MALRMRIAWRGNIRRALRDASRDLQALINYDNKHPSYAFLTPTQHADIINVQAICAALLAQKRMG
jgi:hypothetical protein